MKIALHQFEYGQGNFWERTEEALAQARMAGAKMYVQPELCSYELLFPHALPDDHNDLMVATSAYAAGYVERMSSLAQAYALTIIAGSIPVRQPDGTIYNIAYICAPDGQVFEQGKCHMTAWEVRMGVSPYPAYNVFHSEFGSFAVAICYDVEIPELVRNAGRQGATFLIVPTFTDNLFGSRRVNRTAAAAAEYNQMYVLTCSVCGTMEDADITESHGHSFAYTPSYKNFPVNGTLVESQPNIDQLIFAELDLDQVNHCRNHYDVSPLKDSVESGLIPTNNIDMARITVPV